MAKRSRKTRKVEITRPAVTQRAVQAESVDNGSAVAKNGSDFVNDYYYVYTDMRAMAIITTFMVAAGIGLSYLI